VDPRLACKIRRADLKALVAPDGPGAAHLAPDGAPELAIARRVHLENLGQLGRGAVGAGEGGGFPRVVGVVVV